MCQFGRFRYNRLPFGAALADDMSERKKEKVFKVLPSVFGIVDDTLVVGYTDSGRDHDNIVKGTANIQRSESKTKQR